MKIIYGKHQNRTVPTLKSSDYRPTTAKFREALFNILESGKLTSHNPLAGSRVLDLFAGSGVLSFEALSRGAKFAALIDTNGKHLQLIEQFAGKIGEGDNIKCQLMDASKLTRAEQKYDLVFMDPPYYNNLCTIVLERLIKYDWLEEKAIITMEMEKTATINLGNFPALKMLKEKIYGKSKLLIIQYKAI